MTRFTNPVPKYTDQSGDFMPYGLLYFYESGTNDDKTTFADVNETIPNTQPLVLSGDGSVPNCFYSGSAKVILITNAGTPSLPVDGTQQWERDPVTSASIGSIGRIWDAVSIYDKNSVVIHDDIFYVSIINANQNNNPSSTPSAWSQFDLLNRYNTNETYQLGDPVTASNGFLYTSLIADNTANDPTSTSGFWTLPLVSTPNSENVVINGGFDRWERGTTIVGNVFGPDRWFNAVGPSTTTREVAPADAPYTYNALLTRSNDGSRLLDNPLELELTGNAGAYIIGSIWTIGYDIYTDNPNTTAAALDFSDDMAGTNAVNVWNDAPIVTTGGVWQHITETFTISAAPVGTNVMLKLRIGAGSVLTADNVRIGGVKLEQEGLETGFTRAGNTLAGETALCKRYFEKSYPQDIDPGTVNTLNVFAVVNETLANSNIESRQNCGGSIQMKVTKRVSPIVTLYSPSSGFADMCDLNSSTDVPAVAYSSGDSAINVRLDTGETAVALGRYRYQWTADAEFT